MMEMVMSGTVLTHVRFPRLRLSVAGFLQRLLAGDAAYRNRARLLRLDDHLLRDIGVTRADIAEELRRPLDW
jgi:uncharacterized protein YjiS (DUF1127 family)